MSEQESPKVRKAPERSEKPSPELLARRKQTLTVYVGPDRPFDLPLRTNAILRGEPFPQLAAAVEANPDLKRLFVPVEKLAETRRQLFIQKAAL